VAIYHSTGGESSLEQGTPVPDGTPGELVATGTFPNVPLGFLNDEGGRRFWDAYFAHIKDCWTHGDLVLRHLVTKQIILLGRSDAVLNPSGVRFGSAEIYSVLEGAFPEIANYVCVGQRRPQDHDERVILFVQMKPGQHLTPKLAREIKSKIAKELSKRHVPVHVAPCPDVPVSTFITMAKAHRGLTKSPDWPHRKEN
jgi:acetoacetyl-CoA synthetase